jgi:hypothetical protein
MIKSIVASAAVVAVFMLADGRALAADQWKFKVVNRSDHPVLEFRTREEGEWSDNWISSRLEPGDRIELDFETSEGKCTVRTQITFTDGSRFDANVDYCKVSTLYLYETRMTWD